jgi:hypothetical protein
VREFDKLHEQLIGALLTLQLADVCIPQGGIRTLLDPWPGAQAILGEEWFPLARTRQRALGVTHKSPWPRDSSDGDRFAGRSRLLEKVFPSGDVGAIVVRIRTALGNFSRASLDAEPGEAFVRLAMCLEGLLLGSSKESTTARMSEAASHDLGGSHATRDKNARSQYVHNDHLSVNNVSSLLGDSFSLVQAVLQREIRDLADPPRLIGQGE